MLKNLKHRLRITLYLLFLLILLLLLLEERWEP
jgi:hypothetical protein